jgi:lysophospholipase L1-like esterase
MRICFVGDSMVNGTGDPAYLGWVGRVLQDERTRHEELTGYNLGIRRDRSDQIRARWRAEVEARLPPEVEGRVVFSFGANDAVQGIAPSATLEHARALLSEAAVRWPVFMVGVVPLPDKTVRTRITVLDEALATLCVSLGISYLSVFDHLMETSVWLDEARAGDGAHPGAGGYSRLAAVILASESWRRWMASGLRSAA